MFNCCTAPLGESGFQVPGRNDSLQRFLVYGLSFSR
jgi:hypothetical protein